MKASDLIQARRVSNLLSSIRIFSLFTFEEVYLKVSLFEPGPRKKSQLAK